MKVGDKRKTASGGTVTKTATGVIHKGAKYGGSEEKSKKDESIDTEAFKGKFAKMVETKKEESESEAKKKKEDKKKKIAKIMDESEKPDFLDIDGDGDTKEPMKKAAADKKKADGDEKETKGLSAKQKKLPPGLQKAIAKKKTVKESVEPKLTFREMMKLVVESGGQQQIDPVDQELFAWANRVAKSKLGEGMKAEVYAGMVYERMGGVFEMYDVLSESTTSSKKNLTEETVDVTFINSGFGVTGDEKPTKVEVLKMGIGQDGRPILHVKSPAYGDKMQADWDGKNNRWIVDQD
jgi:hypothetical protein